MTTMTYINAQQAHDGKACGTPKKNLNFTIPPVARVAGKCLALAAAALLMISVSGCSILVATPPAAHVQIDGLNSQLGQFIVLLNPSSEQQMDIPINARYALRLDFRWLWEQGSDNTAANFQDPDDLSSPLTPWLTCKYRF